MLFNSVTYVLFLLLCVSVYWILPTQKSRIGLVVAASLFFYGLWSWVFLLLVLFSALVDYICAGLIFREERPSVRRAWLVFSLSTNVGLLVFFKYTYFLYDNAAGLLSLFGVHLIPPDSWGWRIILPLGISFYTFHTISYTIDIYRRVITKPINSYFVFVAYVMFWPQLVAGPILRFGEVVPQLLEKRTFFPDDFTYGLGRILNGLFKKVVLADTISPLVEYWFDAPRGSMTAIDVWVAATLFGFQIYFDFAGYSDIAIGSARLLGIRFPENFDWPYISRSPREFWRRWHISLSSWIRDYLYLPLTGQHFRTKSEGGISVAAEDGEKKMSEGKRDRALLLTWAIMGVWHGASWNFVLWGLFHGFSVLVYRWVPFLRSLPDKFPRLAWAAMFALATLSWIPFRAQNLSQTFEMLGKVFDPFQYATSPDLLSVSSRTVAYSYAAALFFPAAMLALYWMKGLKSRADGFTPLLLLRKTATVAVMVFLIILCLQPRQQFIYFQF